MHHTPSVDALAAAVRLDAATSAMRARQLEHGPELLDDEPPTSLLDLAAIRAAIGLDGAGADAASVAWLSGPDPDAARIVADVDHLEPADEVTIVTPELAAAVLGDRKISGQTPSRPAVEPQDLRPEPDPEPATVVEPVPVTVAPSAGERAPAPRVRLTDREPRPGWSSRHDPRSLEFGLRDRFGLAPLQDVDLPLGPVLDQGQEGECVGCGTADATNVLRLLAGRPRRELLKLTDASALYHRAQQLDDVPGESYSGTSVLAGMQAAVEAGWFGGYLWAFGTRDIATSLAHGRPVVIGVPWLSGMYDTGPGGLVAVTGEDRGEGHCLVVARLRLKGPQGQPGPFFGWQNSWGKSYGDGGVGWIHHRDLARLLHGVGEAAIPTAEAQHV